MKHFYGHGQSGTLSADDIYNAYLKANTYLNEGLIRTWMIKASYDRRCDWMPRFLAAFGNPEKGIPAIHIAGTSGKGTTGIMIAEILRAAGIKTGLHLTPYLQVSTEKIWIDGLFYHGQNYYDLINDMRPTIEQFRRYDLPLHGMASVVAAIEAFRREKVELMVFETGVGGRYDLTNFLDTAVSVITKIGYDHQKTLGRTISEIAFHKAGIIKRKTPAVALAGRGLRQISAEAKQKKAPLHLVRPGSTFRNERMTIEGSLFDYYGESWVLRDIIMPARGPFQVENGSLAIRTAELLAHQGFPITEQNVRKGLLEGYLPGRIEIIQEKPTVILDGAHNADKMENLRQYLKCGKKQKIVVLCGLLAKKLKRKLVTQIHRIADVIITTEPGVYAKSPFKARDLARIFNKKGDRKTMWEPSPQKALALALDICNPDDVLVVTGSLYLVGNLRAHWFPDREVVLQRTSYPLSDHMN